jgi:glycosyltransferase involved in cell wall biosynthesis
MQMDSPKVSILLPTYNSGQFLRQTLESILTQTYTNIEIIICDDRSKDNSYAIAQSFSDARIRLTQNEVNLGAKGNWNQSLQMATGDLVKIMGADDVLDRDCIKSQVEVFGADLAKEIALVVCQRRVINATNRVLLAPNKPRLSGMFDREMAAKRFVRAGNNPIGEPVVGMFRKEAALATRGFSEEFPYLIDADFWFKLLDHGKLFAQTQTLCSFRISGTSWSARIGRKQFDQYIGFVRSLRQSGKYSLKQADLLISTIRCAVNTLARLGFFLFLR